MKGSRVNKEEQFDLEKMNSLLRYFESCIHDQDLLRKMSLNLDQEIQSLKLSIAKFESLLSALD